MRHRDIRQLFSQNIAHQLFVGRIQIGMDQPDGDTLESPPCNLVDHGLDLSAVDINQHVPVRVDTAGNT